MNRLILIAITALLLCVDALAADRPLIGPGSVSWQRRRMAAQRQAVSSAPTPASWWKLEDTSGTDSAGTNTLSTVGSPVIVSGKSGNCFTNYAAANYFRKTSVAAGSDSFSYTAWVKIASTGTNGSIITKGGSFATLDYMLGYRTSTGKYRWTIGNGTNSNDYIESSTGPSAGVWSFVACGYDYSQRKSWISVDNGTRTWSGSLTNSQNVSANMYIGYDISSIYSQGCIDEVKYFTNSLSDSEITAIYNN